MVAAFLLLFLALPLGAVDAPPAERPAPDFVIDAANRVGAITPFSTEAQLIDAYGFGMVSRGQLAFAGEPPSVGTVLFAGTNRETFIRWRGAFESPQLIKISEPSTPWITMEGVTIGTTLEDLEAINGRPFAIASWDLDRGARTLSWENGAFPVEMVLDLGPHETLSGEEKKALGRRMTHLSSDPAVRKLRFTVRALNINW